MSKQEPEIVGTSRLAAVLGISRQRVAELTRQGIFGKSGRGRYHLDDAVLSYLKFRVQDAESRQASPANERLRAARARAQELANARMEGRLMDLQEALDCTDRIVGIYLASLSGLPGRITRDRRERARLEAIIDAEKQRLSDRFAEIRRELRMGQQQEADNED